MVREISHWTLFLLVTLFVNVQIEAATLTVDDDGPADYTTIQDAIDDSNSGDIVYVYQGIYQEEVTMKDGVITSDSYSPVSPPYWYGVTEQEFQSEDSLALDPWVQCAYQFRLRVYSRTTNGYHYIISKEFNDHYFLNFGIAACNGADLNLSGFVDFGDFALFAAKWLQFCGP